MSHATDATTLAKGVILMTLASQEPECGTAPRKPATKPKMKTLSHPQRESIRTKERCKVSKKPPYSTCYSLTLPLEKSANPIKVILVKKRAPTPPSAAHPKPQALGKISKIPRCKSPPVASGSYLRSIPHLPTPPPKAPTPCSPTPAVATPAPPMHYEMPILIASIYEQEVVLSPHATQIHHNLPVLPSEQLTSMYTSFSVHTTLSENEFKDLLLVEGRCLKAQISILLAMREFVYYHVDNIWNCHASCHAQYTNAERKDLHQNCHSQPLS